MDPSQGGNVRTQAIRGVRIPLWWGRHLAACIGSHLS